MCTCYHTRWPTLVFWNFVPSSALFCQSKQCLEIHAASPLFLKNSPELHVSAWKIALLQSQNFAPALKIAVLQSSSKSVVKPISNFMSLNFVLISSCSFSVMNLKNCIFNFPVILCSACLSVCDFRHTST
jgi:hypothetical protein